MNGTHILLGVSGGIAAYKSAELVRRLREHGAEVQVVMTRGARRFVTPRTFQAVSGRPVRTDLWDQAAEDAMGHIELARWADRVLIAPASAHLLARLAHGLADDLLATLCLATTAPIAVAPAMNQQMWLAAATQSNLQLLQARGVQVLGPGVGDQACGEVGPGRMLEPGQIIAALGLLPTDGGPLHGRRVLITAGPTRECIDPVRFISNRSSGKMGFAMARALREAGAEVVLVSGPVALPTPWGVRRVDVESCDEMMAAVQRELPGTAIFVATAAVADYQPTEVACHKIKKRSASLTLELRRASDILATVSAGIPRPFVVGFAAETDALERHAREKLTRKHLDLIAANEVGHCKAFDSDENALLVLWQGGRVELPRASKEQLARSLTRLIVDRFREAQARGRHAGEGGCAPATEAAGPNAAAAHADESGAGALAGPRTS